MTKIGLIVAREYTTRVRKKSFVIMSILGPILFAAIFLIPVWLTTSKTELTKLIWVLDDAGLGEDAFNNVENLNFRFVVGDLDSLKDRLIVNDVFAVLHLPKELLVAGTPPLLYSNHQPGIPLKSKINWQVQRAVEAIRLKNSGIDPTVLREVKKRVVLKTVSVSTEGEESRSSVEVTSVVGYLTAFLIYFFIFMYGALIMRGVIEEKSNRIIEVLISSVKPFDLMLGKILGVAAVGLTQFLIWLLLSSGLIVAAGFLLMDGINPAAISEISVAPNQEAARLALRSMDALSLVNLPLIIGCFLFYFLGGYLFYGALFAAVGAAVDGETDTQQFMLPVTIPLVFSVVMITAVLQDPTSNLSFWLSIIPFTSPVIMMVRLPFNVPDWQLVISMLLLSIGFVGTTWLAAKVYRIGILVYGTKVSYRTIWKWITARS